MNDRERIAVLPRFRTQPADPQAFPSQAEVDAAVAVLRAAFHTQGIATREGPYGSVRVTWTFLAAAASVDGETGEIFERVSLHDILGTHPDYEAAARDSLAAHLSREADVLKRVSENTELQRQVEASRTEVEAGGRGVPWRQAEP